MNLINYYKQITFLPFTMPYISTGGSIHEVIANLKKKKNPFDLHLFLPDSPNLLQSKGKQFQYAR